MRIRTVKPSLWTDSKTGPLPLATKAVFIALLNYCDDCGVFQYDVVQIKATLFPYEKSDKAIQKALVEIEASGLIKPFVHSSSRYAYVCNFSKHQIIQHRSRPLIENFTESMIGVCEDSHTSIIPVCEGYVSSMEGKEGKGREGKGVSIIGQPKVDRERELEHLFNTLWEKYPRKRGKTKAYKHFKKTITSVDDWKDINAALKTYLESKEVSDGYIKYGSTWFNEWRDWLEPDP